MTCYGKISAVLLMLIVVLLIVSVPGCEIKKDKALDNMTLKIGLMPAVDSVPFLLAEKKGYFEELGLDVKLEVFNNAQNRQSALQTDAIDGSITDMIALVVNVDGGFSIKATMMTQGMFPILAKEDFEDKETLKAGVMEVSVTNYLIDKWLSDDYKIEKVFINDIPTRLSAIVDGELDVGVFPEPVASNGQIQGLEKLVYEFEDGNSPDVLVFTEKALKNKADAIRLMHKAYNKAVADITHDKGEALNVLMEGIPDLNPEIADYILLPEYKSAALPEDEYIQSIIDWTNDIVRRKLDVKPDDLVERGYVD